MIIKNILTLFLCLGFLFSVKSQNHGPQTDLARSFFQSEPYDQATHRDSLAVWREQVLLHLDSEIYRPKETLFFNAYVLTGPKQLRVSASDVLRVELLDAMGNLVIDQYHKIEEGATNGIIELPKKIEAGKYYFRAYTRWMLNYGEENLPVKEVLISKSRKRENNQSGAITIFPESGHLVAGFENKAVISDGNGSAIYGIIINKNGTKVANVMDYGGGLATFTFVPNAEETYYFEKPNGERIELKQPVPEGAVLQANNIEDNKIKIRIAVTDQLREGTYYLIGSKKGKQYLKSEITFDSGRDFVEVDVRKEGLPHGLLNLTLVDSYGQIWAERPFYSHADNLKFSLTEESEIMEDGKRKIRYMLRLTDLEDNPVSDEVVVSLKEVDNSAYVMALASGERSDSFLTDLKVLARRVPEVTSVIHKDELPDQIKYAFQSGLEFYGQAYDLNNTLVANDNIQIYLENQRDVEVREVATNSEGLFSLTNLQLEGKVTMTFRKEGKNVKEQLVKVIPYKYQLPKLKLGEETVSASSRPVRESGQMIPQKRLSDFDFKDRPSDLIPLEEVALVGQRKLRRFSTSAYGIEPDGVVYQDSERPKTIPQLFLGVPGVYVSNIGDLNPSLRLPAMSGIGPLLWVIDGFPLSQAPYTAPPALGGFSAFEPSPLRQVMDIIPFADVERIEFLFGPNAAVFGTRGAGGVILVYTKNGAYSADFLARDEAQIVFQGFQPPIDVADYFASQNKVLKKDKNASTLYWNPAVTTDENGEASLEFIVPENVDRLLLDTKVLTKEGERGSLRSLSRL